MFSFLVAPDEHGVLGGKYFNDFYGEIYFGRRKYTPWEWVLLGGWEVDKEYPGFYFVDSKLGDKYLPLGMMPGDEK